MINNAGLPSPWHNGFSFSFVIMLYPPASEVDRDEMTFNSKRRPKYIEASNLGEDSRL